jgi:hypothetical protein
MIFIDHATNYLFVNHQVNLTCESIVVSKHMCENVFDDYGIQIKQFAADNHPFRSKPWVADCAVQLQQPTRHYGIGAHHQILAERQIQTFTGLKWLKIVIIFGRLPSTMRYTYIITFHRLTRDCRLWKDSLMLFLITIII